MLHKYLPDNNGRLEINVTVRSIDDYEIDSVCFCLQRGHIIITEELTFYILASRDCGDTSIDEWITDQLPAAMGTDTFMDDADRAYEEAYK